MKEKTPAQTTYLTYYHIFNAFRKLLINFKKSGVTTLDLSIMIDTLNNLETREKQSQEGSQPKE